MTHRCSGHRRAGARSLPSREGPRLDISRPMCSQSHSGARRRKAHVAGWSWIHGHVARCPPPPAQVDGYVGQRDPAFRSGLTARGRENAWTVSTCRVVVAELERSRRSPNEAKIEINSDLREPGLAQSGKPRRAKRRRVAFLGGKTERASLAPSALVAQARGERVAHRPEQRRPRSGKLGALHGATGGIGLGRGGIALTRKRARGVNRRGNGTSEAGHA